MFEALDPQTGSEAALVARAVIAHHAAAECFRPAVLPEVSLALQSRLIAQAAAVSRLSSQLVMAPDKTTRLSAETRRWRPSRRQIRGQVGAPRTSTPLQPGKRIECYNAHEKSSLRPALLLSRRHGRRRRWHCSLEHSGTP
jgi:hypothetical protein